MRYQVKSASPFLLFAFHGVVVFWDLSKLAECSKTMMFAL